MQLNNIALLIIDSEEKNVSNNTIINVKFDNFLKVIISKYKIKEDIDVRPKSNNILIKPENKKL
jgi:hypothetical protein